MAIKTLQEVFDCWPSITDMALAVRESPWTVQKWRQRKRIPGTAWASVISAAKRKGVEINADSLLMIHSNARRRSSSRANAN